ncbi:MAG: beta-hydroxyacyl-ACP dehydratase [Candidatus Magnetominusculus sp. LBB02]|nr:beta-hydroxyacyl-ACP dehydratase [Candidatus Magnetominusculus sp. LBB02]
MTERQMITHLPHSMPFIFIEKVLEIDTGRYIRAAKAITAGEEVISASEAKHFPFTLLVEAMAQASGLLLETEQIEMAFLTKINGARHIKPAAAGDVLIIESELIKKFPPLYVFSAKTSVEGLAVAEAEITLTTVTPKKS